MQVLDQIRPHDDMHWDTYVIHWCYIGTKYPSKLPNNGTCQHEAEGGGRRHISQSMREVRTSHQSTNRLCPPRKQIALRKVPVYNGILSMVTQDDAGNCQVKYHCIVVALGREFNPDVSPDCRDPPHDINILHPTMMNQISKRTMPNTNKPMRMSLRSQPEASHNKQPNEAITSTPSVPW